tara:strand:- start:96 stop:515 length:420 start_codon:yes stop_codon:yes gene_type:complete
MIQEELFVITKRQVFEGLVCNNCGERQPLDQFCHMKSGEIKRKCKTCKRDQALLIKKLKEENPYPDEDYSCPICQRDMQEMRKHEQVRLNTWVLDHCHDKKTFRGWLCHNCNTALGAFKDSLDRVKNAVLYLEKDEERS